MWQLIKIQYGLDTEKTFFSGLAVYFLGLAQCFKTEK